MDEVDFIKTIISIIFIVILLVIIRLRFKAFFSWREGDNIKTYINRSFEEYDKDFDARTNMFGSKVNTVLATFVVAVVLFIIFIAISPESPKILKPIIFIYLCVGILKSGKLVDKFKDENYKRLIFTDKIMMRFYFAATWPIHLQKK